MIEKLNSYFTKRIRKFKSTTAENRNIKAEYKAIVKKELRDSVHEFSL